VVFGLSVGSPPAPAASSSCCSRARDPADAPREA
jgi:hypothetical protein